MRRNNKVLLLVENLSVPADPRVWREAQTLRQHGYQVSIICPRGETRDTEPYVCLDDIHIYRYYLNTEIKKSRDYIKEYAMAMLKTLRLSFTVWRRHGFDIIHAANPPDTFFTIGWFYRLLGKKYIFDQHDLAAEMFAIKFKGSMRWLYALLQLCERLSYRTANLVLTTNESQKRHAIVEGHCPPEKVVVVRNGPDDTRFTILTPEPALKRGYTYLLVYIGVMGMQDGVDYVLYALNELVNKRNRQDVGLVLMGNGDQLPLLKNLTQDLLLDQYVHFTGWLGKHDLLRYLSVADIGISPDPSNQLNDYSTMLKTMEYMAMGLPVVAFDLPETRYSAQEAALYATPNEVIDFANKIEILLEDATLRQTLGTYGRQRIENELSWRQTQKHLLFAYQKLLDTPFQSIQPTDGESMESEQVEKITVPNSITHVGTDEDKQPEVFQTAKQTDNSNSYELFNEHV
ncbi:glycosyltransferase family 4 protein [Dictyobacter arantiisoli]|uniref:Glycosyltransferase WbuB n=1 Tax=Dictyobacter arantiisoli TaxID=2014874 RepID=A0A5A5T9X3_9CHLR|nr:glycosyltransferase family 4 protein [Dictyobacter arantiisoli]GCF08222.1 glycosyltransferase WbuB [Dictyobacter arantiisoli]